MYTGELFKLQRQYAELAGHRWWILSAKYGVLEPNEIIEPYDVTRRQFNLDESPDIANPDSWESSVISMLRLKLPPVEDVRVLLFAGSNYRGWVDDAQLMCPSWHISVPLSGLGIGYQRQRLGQMIEELTKGQTEP